ncbi:ribosomal protein S18-alanine N-acetyltransferase [Calothrix rhizosoleniae]|uniref:ribosomal protein S18-alanine N-acetyltransferase n=1 Tax=Calothrix rhizosoleniae TaxID=888997 RepID=UPI000B4A4F4C|nr:ribosomal protein S18-alanine N-acetyltransferase [Calothrix rhizosoleniae]
MNTLNIKLKPVTAEDLDAVVTLDRICFGRLWSLETYQRELDSPYCDLLGLFSTLSSEKLLAMGCFWSILEEAHVTILAVNPQYHHQGLGQAILYFLLKSAYDRGLERATLEVRVSNSPAISLYQKFGFKRAGKRPNYYQDNGEDALILWLSGMQQPQFQTTLAQWYTMICDRLSFFQE